MKRLSNIMDTLKEETRLLHNQTEGNDFQKSLFSGSLPKKQFIEYLGQMYLIHKALEDALSQLKISSPIIASVIEEYQYQEKYLQADLMTAGVKVEELKPLPASKALINRIHDLQNKEPMALLGYEYVLFGSKHGAKLFE